MTPDDALDLALAALVEGCDFLDVPIEQWIRLEGLPFDPDEPVRYLPVPCWGGEEPRPEPPIVRHAIDIIGPGASDPDSTVARFSELRAATGWQDVGGYASGSGETRVAARYFQSEDGVRHGVVANPARVTQVASSPCFEGEPYVDPADGEGTWRASR
ncbi:MAG: hypothetical protein Q4G64_06975 [bacterium]|nr:hypothetical protein [bacterium]